MSFTPGPWRILIEDIGDDCVCCVPVEIHGADNFPVVSSEGGLAPYCEWKSEMIYANARLIAAAPDMYEALREVLDDLPFGEKRLMVTRALVKAKGGSPE